MELRLLGPLELVVDGVPIGVGPPRQRAVLAMLALAAPHVVSTDRFVDGLWGEDPPDQPLPALQVFIHGLRKALRQAGDVELIVRVAPGYRLDVAPDAIDANRFERLHEEARDLRERGAMVEEEQRLRDALALWRGPALADLRSTPFAEAEAARLDDLRMLAEEDLYDAQLRLGQHQQLAATLEQQVAAHPMRERLWGQLMTALYRCDRQADALAAYARAREQLAEELGIDPGQALQQLELAVLRQDPALAPPASARPADAGPGHGLAPRRLGQVPPPLTATFGREQLVNEVLATVRRPDVRVVTLTGPGGSGKSRVAVLAARDAAAEFGDGVHFLGATELTSADQLRAEVLLALTGRDVLDEDSPRIASALVVLDNLESVPEGASLVTELVEELPGLTVLATSRLPLLLRAEHEIPIPPLPVPDEDCSPDVTAQTPAVSMFVDRARAVNPDLDLDRHLGDVAALCRFVDGLPLAIELAAAHARLLTPAQLLASLQQDLALLATRDADVPERQQSLTATLEWTFDRLGPEARVVAERLALFERGFTTEAVEAVCADVPDVLAALTEIARARLIRPVPSAVEMRFVVLGTVRAFARRRLQERDDVDERRSLLGNHLLGRVRAWSAQLDGPEGAVILGRYADSAADLDGAVEWALGQGDLRLARELIEVLTDLWVASGRLRQGLARCHQVLASPGLSSDDEACVRLAAGKLDYYLGDWPAATAECRAVLAMADLDPHLEAAASCYLGGALIVDGEVDQGAEHAERAHDLATLLGDYRVRVVSLSMLAISRAIRRDFEGERAFYEQRLTAVHERGDLARLADTLNTLAEIALDEEDPETAAAYAAESLVIAGRILPLEARDATITLARAAVATLDRTAARAHLETALALADGTGQALAQAQCLRVAGCLAVLQGAHAEAAQGFAAAQVLSPTLGGSDEPLESDLRTGFLAAREALSPAEFQRAWLLGKTLPAATIRARLLAVV